VLAFSYPWWGLEGPLSFIFNDGLGIDNDTLFNMSVYVMLALGLNVVVGYAGLLDLGYVAFFALGAYTLGWFGSGLFSTRDIHFLDTNATRLPGIHLSFWAVVILAGAVCAFAGVLIGWPTLRLRGDYLAIVTLGFGEIIPDVFRNGDSIAGHNLTGGVRGGRGSRSARTRSPPRRWACRSCARSSGPMRSAPSSAASPALCMAPSSTASSRRASRSRSP
jgi:branched-chain amino acid transport system permease protein